MSSHGNDSPSPTPLSYLSFHSDTPVFGGTHFVGSPGQINLGEPSTPRIRPIPSLGSLPSFSQRPNLGHRSVSHIVTHAPQTPQPVNLPQSFRESFRASLVRPTPEQQWSLFEQLMENEGQLTSPGRHAVNASHRSQLSSAGASASENNVDPFHTAPRSPELERTHGYSSHFESENESQADQASSDDSSATAIPQPASNSRFLPFQVPVIPILWRNVLKCAVSYLLASLFTFSPYLSGFISDISSPGPGTSGPSPTGHMVASMYAS
jgi:hypothetical protein